VEPCRKYVARALCVRAVAAAAVAVFALTALAPGTALAASGGQAQIVRPADGTPLNSGGSATQFALSLPTTAHCSGDSTEPPFYRAYSYLVPSGTSPTAVSFKTGWPSRWYGLYSFGTYFSNNVTKGTGQVGSVIPGNLTFSPLPARAFLTAGQARAVWEAGVACADLSGTVASYWSVQVAFLRDPADAKGYTWTVTHQVASGRNSVGFDLAALGVAGVLGVAAIAVLFGRRTSRPQKGRVA